MKSDIQTYDPNNEKIFLGLKVSEEILGLKKRSSMF